MSMLRKTFLLIIFLLLSACGYEAIHSKKNIDNYNFSINELSFLGDRTVNLKIKEKLNIYTLNKKNKNFSLKVFSITKKEILGKNVSGDPVSFKSSVSVKIEYLDKNRTKNNISIVESFNYNNNANKFDLKKYEKEIKNNLAELITNKLIFKLTKIQ
jgi:outer membrane lipopolysaccharide assembly protein LptE/RlpB